MDAYVELLKQTVELIYLIVEERYCEGPKGIPKTISKDEAIIGGNLTRLIKLNTSFLENICNGKTEIALILSRCIAETAINIKYMLIEGEEKVLRNYIKYSLITEKELWNKINDNVEKRNGEKLDIEKRMQKSIEKSFDTSDFNIDDVKRSSKWKSISERAKMVAGEQFYKIFYGVASHSVHGNWQDILFHNLKDEGNGDYKLNLNWNSPGPQLMESAITFNLNLTNLFVDKEQFANKKDYQKTVKILSEYQTDLHNYHETHLKKRNANIV